MSSPLPDEAPRKVASAPFFSDLLPPALVLDMRQTMRSPINLFLAIIGIMLVYSTVLGLESENLAILMLLHSLLLFAFIPFRAGQKIARDIRERGSNFLKLCPLSAGRIVWGQFLSCSLQLLLISVPLIPIYFSAAFWLPAGVKRHDMILQYVMQASPGVFLLCALVVAAAMLMTALMMAIAILPLMFRVIIQTGIIIGLILSWIGHLVGLAYSTYLGSDNVPVIDAVAVTWLIVIGIVFALAFSAMLLIIASRYYSSHVEASSGRLRLLQLVCLVGMFAVCWAFQFGLDRDLLSWAMCGFGFIPFLVISLMDELMPNVTASGLSPRRRGFVGYLTRRVTGANLISIFVLALVSCLGSWWLVFGGGAISELNPISGGGIDTELMSLMIPLLALIYSAVSALAVTDLLIAKDSRNRLLGFGMGVVVLLMIGSFVVSKTYFPFHCVYLTLFDFESVGVSGVFVRMLGACLGSVGVLAVVHAVRKG